MRIIAFRTLRECYPDAKTSEWENSNGLKKQYKMQALLSQQARRNFSPSGTITFTGENQNNAHHSRV